MSYELLKAKGGKDASPNRRSSAHSDGPIPPDA